MASDISRPVSDTPIRMAQLALYINNHLYDRYATPVFGALTACALNLWLPLRPVLIWLAAAIAAMALTQVVYRRFPRATKYLDDTSREICWTHIIAAVHGLHMLIWSSIVVWGWVPGAPDNHMFILLILAGAMASTTAMSAPHRLLFATDMTPIMIAMILRPLMDGGLLNYCLTGIGTAFCFLMYAVGLQTHSNVETMLRLRYENKALINKLGHLATTDHLTGALNRREFNRQARKELARATRYGHAVSFLLLDIDNFKRINDTFGHPVGDQAICKLADCCQTLLRATDAVARFGGEEFAVLLPETDCDDAYALGERLRQALHARPMLLDGKPIPFTASIGLSCTTIDGHDLDKLISRADHALYTAKHQGKDCVVTSRQTALTADAPGFSPPSITC